VEYAGGDTKESDINIFSGMCMGHQKKQLTRLRSEIKPGQILCSTGKLGKVGAASIAYARGADTRENSRRMLDVTARVREGMVIGSSGSKFMMDISDGLYGCLWQMKRDYGIGFRISEMDVDVDDSVKAVSSMVGISQRDLAFNYGGDYELLFTIDNDDYGRFSKKMEDQGIVVHYIGDTWKGDNMIFDGEQWEKIEQHGWEHLTEKVRL
jgi:Thiamine monophosphate kinase